MNLVMIFFGAIFFNNFIFNRFMGICPFLGVSKRLDTSVGMGMAVAFVMTVASTLTWLLQKLLVLWHLEYMQTIVFILVIAALVQFVEMFLQKVSPTLYKALGVYLPLITTNCAILGIAILNIGLGYNLLETIIHSLGASAGFTLAMVILAGIREKLELSDVPEAFSGVPIALITAGIIAMAFSGFVL
ncbi:MAG: RnfABCDGE type electron transport complex subunit A [Eubacteriales bacterium]|nr:RnfABCDGE type electron transport complex subunit A [Eubacteriales bacterium]